MHGKFDGLLQDASGKPLAINGLWALSPGTVSPNNNNSAAPPAAEVYFAAGPNHGSGGLFGYLTAVLLGIDRRELTVNPGPQAQRTRGMHHFRRGGHSTCLQLERIQERNFIATVVIPSDFYISDVQKARVSEQVTAMELREPLQV
jgi:hypothetical protein